MRGIQRVPIELIVVEERPSLFFQRVGRNILKAFIFDQPNFLGNGYFWLSSIRRRVRSRHAQGNAFLKLARYRQDLILQCDALHLLIQLIGHGVILNWRILTVENRGRHIALRAPGGRRNDRIVASKRRGVKSDSPLIIAICAAMQHNSSDNAAD